MDPSSAFFLRKASLWGQAYEILVKRGVLACLIEQGLVAYDYPSLECWRNTKVRDVAERLGRALDVIDVEGRDALNASVDHLAIVAYGTGYTATRSYLDLIDPRRRPCLRVRALWCPLTLPSSESDQSEIRQIFREEFGLSGPTNVEWSDRGGPANSDFTLWLSGEDDYLLVQEYSYNMSFEAWNFRKEDAHLNELRQYRRIVNLRGAFSRINAEVDDSFEISDSIASYFNALKSHDKPLYKLCQASSYAVKTVTLLQKRGLLTGGCVARALAITPNGLESLAARIPEAHESNRGSRAELMNQMGKIYHETKNDETPLDDQIQAVFEGMLNKLPKSLKSKINELPKKPIRPGDDLTFSFDEIVPDFVTPAHEFPLDDIASMAEGGHGKEVDEYFGIPVRDAIMQNLPRGKTSVSLRDIHAAAIVAGLKRARRGELNVLALEGNPGIGKTTAICNYLKREQRFNNPESGYLFLYVSPRVVINGEVTRGMARDDEEQQTGILTLTTNSSIIASARQWMKDEPENGKPSQKESAGKNVIVADGVEGFNKPRKYFILTPEMAKAIEKSYGGKVFYKRKISERDEIIQDIPREGVIQTLMSGAKELLDINPGINRIVLTMAIQGLKKRSNGGTTIKALSKIFANPTMTRSGREERRRFAARMPAIVVMIDELTGDGAGAPFVHAVCDWLEEEFVDCFEDADEESPFTPILVVSDASLGNEIVLGNYLGNRNTPDKILLSPSYGESPFRLAVTDVRISTHKHKTLHVMTNSFPASELHICYKARMTKLAVEKLDPNSKKEEPRSIRQIVSEQRERIVENDVTDEILYALNSGARQVIYYAQDKKTLSETRKFLCEKSKKEPKEQRNLNLNNVRILDSSVPQAQREESLKPENRDKTRVFLMTSSGARGISFPLADWIIVRMPRFNIEAGLMEITQAIYRGRGGYRDTDGKWVSCDDIPRHLVAIIDDYLLLENEELDKRRWLMQSVDLLTMLVILRSAILTRITGDSGLEQSIALVPVGGINVEKVSNLMSQYVQNFLHEAEFFINDKENNKDKGKEEYGTVYNARNDICDLFRQLELLGNLKDQKQSLVNEKRMHDFTNSITASTSPLLVRETNGLSIPNRVGFTGPVMIERWNDVNKQEIFNFELHSKKVKKLKGRLLRIKGDDYPQSLKNAAANLLEIVKTDFLPETESIPESTSNVRIHKNSSKTNIWIAVPAGYCQFLYSYSDQQEIKTNEIKEPSSWRKALGETLVFDVSTVMPPIARYKSFPWAASSGEKDPLNFDLIFDDRYFFVSNELNLLNTLLLLRFRS